MKHKSFLKKTHYLVISFVFLFVLNACGQNSTSTPETSDALPAPNAMVTADPAQLSDSGDSKTSDDVSSVNNDALAAYDNFLAGSINAQDLKHEISDGVVTMKDISQNITASMKVV